MKKKVAALILSFTMVFTMAACGNSGGEGNKNNADGQNTETSADAEGTGDSSDFGEYTADKPLVLRLATPQSNENSHLNTIAVKFKESVEEASGGAVTVDIYMGTMGTDREIVDQVIAGTLDMGVNNTAILANYNSMFDVLDIGYLIQDYDDVYDVMESDVWDEMLGQFSDTGASLLCLQCIGFRTICTTPEAGMVKNLSDLKGKTLRVTEGDIFLEDYDAWGASPISMSASEIMPALQNGTIDGVDHAPVTLYTGDGQAEYVKNVSVFNQAAHFNGIDINNTVLENMPDGIREIVKQAAYDAALENTKELETANETYIEKLQDEYDVEFYYPTEVEIAEMKEAVKPVYENFVSTHEYGSYAEQINEICESN